MLVSFESCKNGNGTMRQLHHIGIPKWNHRNQPARPGLVLCDYQARPRPGPGWSRGLPVQPRASRRLAVASQGPPKAIQRLSCQGILRPSWWPTGLVLAGTLPGPSRSSVVRAGPPASPGLPQSCPGKWAMRRGPGLMPGLRGESQPAGGMKPCRRFSREFFGRRGGPARAA